MNKVSKTEDRLYDAMRDIGLRPERQYPISRMKVDFALPKERLVIEVDGPYKRNSVGMKTLFERKRACEKEGWKVENFTAEEVFEDANNVARRIYHILKNEERKNKKLDIEFSKSKRTVELKEGSHVSPSELERMREENIRDYRKKHHYEDSITLLAKSSLSTNNKVPNFKKDINFDKILKYGAIIVIVILFIWIFEIRHFISSDKPEIKQDNLNQEVISQPEIKQDNLNQEVISQPEKIEPLVITGSKTDVIIKNNQPRPTSLNITYRIYSNWFGIDSQNSQVFEIGANEEKSFRVYNNVGCSTAPCSVSIISYGEVEK